MKNNSFSIPIYLKPTFSGVFTISKALYILIFRAFNLCSSFVLFHQEIVKLKNILKKKFYSSNAIDICVKNFSDRLFIERKIFALKSKNYHLLA